MQKLKLTLAAAALIAAFPLLQGCVPAVIGAGAAAGVMTAHDRRSTGAQADDEGLEWKAAQQIPENYQANAHVNFTAFNRRLLITGEAPSEEAQNAIGERVGKLEGVKEVFNETVVGAASSLSSRTNDSYVTSKVKARLFTKRPSRPTTSRSSPRPASLTRWASSPSARARSRSPSPAPPPACARWST